MPTPCDYIENNMSELFQCAPVNGSTRIRTPYLYPDGDVIDVFLVGDGFPTTLTDFGDTLGWLWTQTVANRRTDRQQRLIRSVCETHGIEYYRGMLNARVKEPEMLSEVVTRLSQAALRVSDLWFTFRSQAAASINDEVADFLREIDVGFERGERIPGRSGQMWNIDFHARSTQRSTLVNVLSTGSKAQARRTAEHNLATWYDLSHYRLGPEGYRFVSLFDDELDVWSPEDFQLLEGVSELAYWSRKDQLAELLIS